MILFYLLSMLNDVYITMGVKLSIFTFFKKNVDQAMRILVFFILKPI